MKEVEETYVKAANYYSACLGALVGVDLAYSIVHAHVDSGDWKVTKEERRKVFEAWECLRELFPKEAFETGVIAELSHAVFGAVVNLPPHLRDDEVTLADVARCFTLLERAVAAWKAEVDRAATAQEEARERLRG